MNGNLKRRPVEMIKSKKNIFTLCVLILFCTLRMVSQQGKIDSLFTCLMQAKEDTVKVNSLNLLSRLLLMKGEFQNGDSIANQAFSLAKKLGFKWGMSRAGSNCAMAKYYLSDYKEALDQYFNSIELSIELGDKPGLAKKYNNVALIYIEQGNYVKSLSFYLMALKIYEELKMPDGQIGDKQGVATTFGNIGIVYMKEENFPRALEYYFKSININNAIGRKEANAANFHNLGIVYRSLGAMASAKGDEKLAKEHFDLALKYYFDALEINEISGNKSWKGNNLLAIGNVYQVQKNYAKVEAFYSEALKLHEELGSRAGIAECNFQLGTLYYDQTNYSRAEKFLKKSLETAEKIGALGVVKNIHQNLSSLYEKKGDFKSSLEHYRIYSINKDSIFNSEKDKEFTRSEMNYEFEKKEAEARSEQDKKDAVTAAEKKKQLSVLVLVCSMLLLVFIFSGFIFRSLRITKKQKNLIEIKNRETEEQKMVIEEKNKDILASIHYAKRIQQSLLPTEKYIARNLKR